MKRYSVLAAALRTLVAIWWLLSLATTAAHAQIVRTEVIAFPSMTLTDQQFLTGSKEGVPVTIAGVLRLPPPGPNKIGVAVLLHGSGGVSAYVTDWEQDFNALGMATFAIDSFSGRGIVNTNVDQFVLGRLAMIIDAYRALDLLAKHPRIDPNRIVLMGFSRGGQSALYASMKRFQKMHGTPGLEYAAYVPLYAACNTTYYDDEDLSDRPVRMFHGTDDNYVSVVPCRSYVARLKAKGQNVQFTEYAGAGHVFDGKSFKVPLIVPNWQTSRKCSLAESQNGLVINASTKQPFANGDPCIEFGPTVVYNEQASVEARKAVADLMKTSVLAR